MRDKGSIIYIGGFELPDRNAAAHQVLNNAKIMRSLGYKVVFCGIDKSISQKEELHHDVVDGFDSYPIPYPNSVVNWISYMMDFKHMRGVIEREKNARMIIAYNMHAVPLLRIIRYCKKRGIKVIANITEWYENPFSLVPTKAIKSIDTVMVMRKIHKKVDGIISVSRYLYEYYKKWVDDIIIVPPLIDINEEKWVSAGKHQSNTEYTEFIYSGTIGDGNKSRKDKLCPVINCFNELREETKFHFSVVGIEKNDFLECFPEMKAIVLNLGERITFYGRVSHSDSIKRLINADYCIFIRDASRKNNAGFPTKFVESWTSGVNIIASNISDISLYFPKDRFSVLLQDNAQDTILKAINKSLSYTSNDIDMHRRNGLDKDNPFYLKNWETQMDQFLERIDSRLEE